MSEETTEVLENETAEAGTPTKKAPKTIARLETVLNEKRVGANAA